MEGRRADPSPGRELGCGRRHNQEASEAGEEGEQGVGGAVAAGFDVERRSTVERSFFDGQVAVEVMLAVVSTRS